jgi:ribonuclease P protein component
MPRAQRLRQRRDIAAVYRSGRVFRNNVLTIRILETGMPVTRSAFAVSGRLGNAVVRNRTRRRMREVVRSLALEPGWDILLSARPDAVRLDYQQLRAAIAGLLGRAGVVKEASA